MRMANFPLHTHSKGIMEFVIQMISDFQFSVRSTILSSLLIIRCTVTHSTAACISCSGAAPPPSSSSSFALCEMCCTPAWLLHTCPLSLSIIQCQFLSCFLSFCLSISGVKRELYVAHNKLHTRIQPSIDGQNKRMRRHIPNTHTHSHTVKCYSFFIFVVFSTHSFRGFSIKLTIANKWCEIEWEWEKKKKEK